ATRRENVRAPAAYLASAVAGRVATTFEESLSKKEAIGDRLLAGVRAAWGVDLFALEEETHLSGKLETALHFAIERLAAEGLVELSHRVLTPTRRGFLFADRIGRTLLEGLERLDTPSA